MRAVPTTIVALYLVATTALASPTGGSFAGPTRATGGSLYWNPAALADLGAHDGVVVLGELMGLAFSASYLRHPLDPATEPAYDELSFISFAPDPSFALSWASPFSDWHLMAGGYSVTGLGVNWPADGPQRYFATNSNIFGYGVAGGVLYTPDPRFGVSFMAGPAYYRAHVENDMDFGAFANSSLPPGAQLFAYEDPNMSGHLESNTDGFGAVFLAGVWARPLPMLRLGVGFTKPTSPLLSGTVTVSEPPLFESILPGYEFSPHGDVALKYGMPWILNSEASVTVGATQVAVLLHYVRRSASSSLVTRVTKAEPNLIEGDTISVRNHNDDWLVGVRASQVMSEDLELCFRIDYDPIYIPREVLSPVNLDFNQTEFSVAARYQMSPGQFFTLSYGYVHIPSIEVTNSLFNPRAPSGSGLASPSANGIYDAWAHKLTLSFEGLFGSS